MLNAELPPASNTLTLVHFQTLLALLATFPTVFLDTKLEAHESAYLFESTMYTRTHACQELSPTCRPRQLRSAIHP